MSDAVVKENAAFELIKSVLVIPVTVAVVMAIAWGLVRWAAARQADSGKPDPRPDQRRADGSLSLTIPFAQVSGEIHYHGARQPTLENWRRADETVAWRFEVDQPGRYAVELDCACDAANAGSTVLVELEGTTLEAAVPDTGSWHTFKTVRVGNVEFPSAGWRDLRLVPAKVAHNAVMVLRGVRLLPGGTSS